MIVICLHLFIPWKCLNIIWFLPFEILFIYHFISVFLFVAKQFYCEHSPWYMDRKATITITSVILILPMCFPKRIDFLKYARFVYIFLICQRGDRFNLFIINYLIIPIFCHSCSSISKHIIVNHVLESCLCYNCIVQYVVLWDWFL